MSAAGLIPELLLSHFATIAVAAMVPSSRIQRKSNLQ
jgi:hypothetical protein